MFVLLYKVLSAKQVVYIYDLLPPMRKASRHPNKFNSSSRTEYFKNSFSPGVVNNWNMLNPDILDSSSYSIYGKSLLKFIRFIERKP